MAEGMMLEPVPPIAAATALGVTDKDAKRAETPTSLGKTIKAEKVDTPKESKITDLKRKLVEVRAKAQDRKVREGF